MRPACRVVSDTLILLRAPGPWVFPAATRLCFLFGLFAFVFSKSVSPPANLGRIDTLSEGVLRSGESSKTSADICG